MKGEENVLMHWTDEEGRIGVEKRQESRQSWSDWVEQFDDLLASVSKSDRSSSFIIDL